MRSVHDAIKSNKLTLERVSLLDQVSATPEFVVQSTALVLRVWASALQLDDQIAKEQVVLMQIIPAKAFSASRCWRL